jgi:hypothetical protein
MAAEMLALSIFLIIAGIWQAIDLDRWLWRKRWGEWWIERMEKVGNYQEAERARMSLTLYRTRMRFWGKVLLVIGLVVLLVRVIWF